MSNQECKLLVRKLVLLPNRLYPSGCSSCLIVKNLSEDDIESTIEETNELLKQQDISFIENVLPYDKLKKEYKGMHRTVRAGFVIW